MDKSATEESQAPLNQEHCEFSQIERTHHLEQALDQCQVYLSELQLQLMNQEFLKGQLAATEEISHIQQQAITALRTRLADQQALSTQQGITLQTAVIATQPPAQLLQTELEHFRTQLFQEQAEARTFQQQLEQEIIRLQMLLKSQQQQSEALDSQRTIAQNLADSSIGQFKAAQTKVEALQSHLSDRQTTIIDLESRLQRSQAALAVQQQVLSALAVQHVPASESEKNQVIQGLSKNLLNAQTKIEALETEFSSQLVLQAKLQHACQELEQERDRDQNRIRQLEQQVTEMQEQILKQAQQSGEYEAAVQHWKDQCLCAENSVIQLKAVLEQILKERIPELTTATHTEKEDTGLHPSDESEPSGFLKGIKLDLPSFLHLRRNSKS